jgi:hypothetical protein
MIAFDIERAMDFWIFRGLAVLALLISAPLSEAGPVKTYRISNRASGPRQNARTFDATLFIETPQPLIISRLKSRDVKTQIEVEASDVELSLLHAALLDPYQYLKNLNQVKGHRRDWFEAAYEQLVRLQTDQGFDYARFGTKEVYQALAYDHLKNLFSAPGHTVYRNVSFDLYTEMDGTVLDQSRVGKLDFLVLKSFVDAGGNLSEEAVAMAETKMFQKGHPEQAITGSLQKFLTYINSVLVENTGSTTLPLEGSLKNTLSYYIHPDNWLEAPLVLDQFSETTKFQKSGFAEFELSLEEAELIFAGLLGQGTAPGNHQKLFLDLQTFSKKNHSEFENLHKMLRIMIRKHLDMQYRHDEYKVISGVEFGRRSGPKLEKSGKLDFVVIRKADAAVVEIMNAELDSEQTASRLQETFERFREEHGCREYFGSLPTAKIQLAP